jgi:ABC-type polysaccharide/polyol phosphate export permease
LVYFPPFWYIVSGIIWQPWCQPQQYLSMIVNLPMVDFSNFWHRSYEKINKYRKILSSHPNLNLKKPWL